MTEVYKWLNGISPDIVNDALSKHQYNTRRYNIFVTDLTKTDRYGWNSIPYRANQIWNLEYPCVEYPCTLCKTNLPNLGYL